MRQRKAVNVVVTDYETSYDLFFTIMLRAKKKVHNNGGKNKKQSVYEAKDKSVVVECSHTILVKRLLGNSSLES